MNRVQIEGKGVAIEAWVVDEVSGPVRTLGVAVEFHPGIPTFAREMCLESTLRHWQREVGSVVRVGKPEWNERGVYLRGWTMKRFKEGTVVGMRLAFRHDDENDVERSA